ncbi:MAG TPA: protease inhibitor I42 family protein [Kineosporiaceae bacterium]|nr:protease inhibitor I42 family protein [Kineosporiaceae bacterium]
MDGLGRSGNDGRQGAGRRMTAGRKRRRLLLAAAIAGGVLAVGAGATWASSAHRSAPHAFPGPKPVVPRDAGMPGPAASPTRSPAAAAPLAEAAADTAAEGPAAEGSATVPGGPVPPPTAAPKRTPAPARTPSTPSATTTPAGKPPAGPRTVEVSGPGKLPAGPVQARVGDRVVVHLTEQAGSTGYSWSATTVPAGLTPAGDTVVPGPAVPGAPGEHTFTFQVTQAGTGTLKFTLARPWAPTPPADEIVVTLQIGA